MLDASKSITITCSWYDGNADVDRETSFTLDGVSVHFERAASASGSGITASYLAKIRIPFRSGYLPWEKWMEQQKAKPGNNAFWTLCIGATVLVDGESKTILRCHDNTGRRFCPHWYVEAR